jgi:hypothetical protein
MEARVNKAMGALTDSRQMEKMLLDRVAGDSGAGKHAPKRAAAGRGDTAASSPSPYARPATAPAPQSAEKVGSGKSKKGSAGKGIAKGKKGTSKVSGGATMPPEYLAGSPSPTRCGGGGGDGASILAGTTYGQRRAAAQRADSEGAFRRCLLARQR